MRQRGELVPGNTSRLRHHLLNLDRCGEGGEKQWWSAGALRSQQQRSALRARARTERSLERRTYLHGSIHLLYVHVLVGLNDQKQQVHVRELPDAMCIWLQLKPVAYHLCQSLII